MKFLKPTLLILLFSVILACKNDKNGASNEEANNTVSTFYFIRHAEKDRSDQENQDPELAQEGLGRSIFWAKVFEPIALDAIYSTDYQRTQMTAAPTSVQKNISVISYDPSTIEPQQFVTDNYGKKVLVVGHSNTVPKFVNAIIGEEKFEQIDDYDNSGLFIVTIIGTQATAVKLNLDISRQ
ncbi:MAG: histidine phosphatase family protein [Cellulophaga fucicola]